MRQQAAKSLMANDHASVSILFPPLADRHIANPLVRSSFVIMREEFRDDVAEILLTKNHEMF